MFQRSSTLREIIGKKGWKTNNSHCEAFSREGRVTRYVNGRWIRQVGIIGTTRNVIGRELPALEMMRAPASLLNVLFRGDRSKLVQSVFRACTRATMNSVEIEGSKTERPVIWPGARVCTVVAALGIPLPHFARNQKKEIRCTAGCVERVAPFFERNANRFNYEWITLSQLGVIKWSWDDQHAFLEIMTIQS